MWGDFIFHMINDHCYKYNLSWKHRCFWVCFHVPAGWCGVYGSEFISLLLLVNLCWFWMILTSLLALLYSRLPLNYCCESWKEKRSLIVARCLPRWQSSLGLFLWDALSLSVQLELTALKWSSHGPLRCLHQSEWTMEEHQLPHPLVTSLWQSSVWTLVLCFTAMAGEVMSTFCIPENHRGTNLKSSHPQTHENRQPAHLHQLQTATASRTPGFTWRPALCGIVLLCAAGDSGRLGVS